MELPRSFIRPIAHRGLHDHRARRIENSAAAFEAAIAGGFGIECDVRSAAGGLPVVFHDAHAQRLLGINAATDTLSGAQLSELAYADGSRVMTFEAFLALIGGRVPVLAEVKSNWSLPAPAFVAEVSRLASSYSGPLALMSFDPEWMAAFREKAPQVARGLVVSGAGKAQGVTALDRSGPQGEALSDLLVASDRIDASFAAFDIRVLPTPASETLRRIRRMPVFTWTVRAPAELQTAISWADAPIFEGDVVGPNTRS